MLVMAFDITDNVERCVYGKIFRQFFLQSASVW